MDPKTKPIPAKKDISAKVGSYGERIITGGAPTPSPLTEVSPIDSNARYSSADESICTVDSITGELKGVNEGNCRVTLTLSRTGYRDKVIEYITPVILSLGDFKGKHLFKGLILGVNMKFVFADVDGDGDQDLVVGESTGTLKYYQKNAADAPSLFTEQTGEDNPFNAIKVGGYSAPIFFDIDGDSNLDLVLGALDGTLKYFLNESAGDIITFTEQTGTDNPFSGFDVGGYSTPTFADVDEDGDLDLVVGENGGTLKYFLNESAGSTITFTAKTAASENPFNGFDVGTHAAPAFADIDGDGDLDLVVGGRLGILNYFLNESTNNTITFTAKTAASENPFNSINIGTYSTPTFADIDGDGDLDLVVGGHVGILNYFLNESTGGSISFTDKTSTKNPFNGFDVENYAIPTLADIDGDGDQDFVVGERGGTLKYFLNESTGGSISFTEKTSDENPFNSINIGTYSTPTFADVDGDGDQDLVVGESTGTLKYFRNESTGGQISFTKKTGTDNPFNGFDVGDYAAPTIADIDGDGDLDLIVGAYDGTLKYFLNESVGSTITFTPKTPASENPFNGFDVGASSAPTFADIDGDGDLDMAVGESDGILNYFLNESTGGSISFTEKAGVENPFNGFDVGDNSAPIFADIDGDGDLDMVVGNTIVELTVIFNYYGAWIPFR